MKIHFETIKSGRPPAIRNVFGRGNSRGACTISGGPILRSLKEDKMSQPGFFFYTGDWLKDTRVLTPSLRGCWIDLLCVLHESGGEITWTLDDLATFWTVERRTGDAFVRALSRLKVADVTEVSQDNFCISCRKMKRAALARENTRLRKQKERDRKKKYRDSHEYVTAKYSASSSSSSESNLKEITADAGFNVKNVDSKPLKTELNPRLKSVADRIYQSDIKKFARLIVWIKEAQREHFNDDDIITALMQFEPYAPAIEKWYPYLDKIIEKVQAVTNAREAEAQSKVYKRELSEIYAETKKGKG